MGVLIPYDLCGSRSGTNRRGGDTHSKKVQTRARGKKARKDKKIREKQGGEIIQGDLQSLGEEREWKAREVIIGIQCSNIIDI